ncbi:MAG: hypothetical protein ACRDAM_06125, partial [Casimicrobium sp.]
AILDEKLLAHWAESLRRENRLNEAAYVVSRAREFPANPAFDGLPTLAPNASASNAMSRMHPRDFRR